MKMEMFDIILYIVQVENIIYNIKYFINSLLNIQKSCKLINNLSF